MTPTISLMPDLTKTMSYSEYRTLVDDLMAQGKTTGENHSPGMLAYTEQNIHRMSRHDKHDKLLPELLDAVSELKRKLLWIVISEAWCGDAAHNLPILNKIAEQSANIEMRIILRDENLDFMDQHLTNGGRSIPKLVVFDAETEEEIGAWGPRPQVAQQIFVESKAAGEDYKVFAEKLHLWYGRDRNKTVQSEFVDLLKQWS